jgi:sugar phosphate isomerase/epimerase
LHADRIALQLYTLRRSAAADFPGTLAEVARIGYRAVELAGLHGRAPDEIRAMLDRLGIRAVAAHVPLEHLETRPDESLNGLRVLGCSYAVLPSLPKERRAIGAAAATLNELGRRCAESGLRFGYHNHAFELASSSPGGETLLDRLIAATDPQLVAFELDVYWAAVGGADPAELIERHAGRIHLLHVKDVGSGGEDAPVGEGTLEWPELLAASRAAGIRWYVVEQDEPADPLADVETSLTNALRML